MARAKKKLSTEVETADYRHADEKRKNIPLAKIAAEGKVPVVAKAQYAYSPHLAPALRFDPSGDADALSELLQEASQRPLKPDELRTLAQALRTHEPWLEWAGKREQHARRFLEVDPVALHMHERVSARAILRAAGREDVQRDLFADPQLPYEKEVKFYQYDIDWTNRLILGDSLQVMSSLARRENLAGKVQTIYMDPPYGISYASNFQPSIAKRQVKDADDCVTQEPEQIRAYRDTWRLGVHSYLTYLRDRLVAARELLDPRGSIFVQISDHNVHHLRELLDQVFGPHNFMGQIVYRTSVPLRSAGLGGVYDLILWYARDIEQAKFRQLFVSREEGDKSRYANVELPDGSRRSLTKEEKDDPDLLPEGSLVFADMDLASSGYTASCTYDFEFNSKVHRTSSGKSWKTTREGMDRLGRAERVSDAGKTIRYVLYRDDYPVQKLTNMWTDTTGETSKAYVVQTHSKVVERCLLMTSDPGDLVLDPTCGSGTSAYVAENWGRRWIAIDTSRVAIAIARQRLLCAHFDYYKTQESISGRSANPGTGFCLRKAPHITLSSIAQNQHLDPIFSKHEAGLDSALKLCNKAVRGVPPTLRRTLEGKLAEKEKSHGKRAVTEADRRRWLLPASSGFEHWTVPFDTDTDWPRDLREAVTGYRVAWRAKMDDVNACIAGNADHEDLVDQPEIVKSVLRVSGPFTLEGVRPQELSLKVDPTDVESDQPDEQIQSVHAYLSRMIQLIRQDGLTFINNKHRRFARVESLYEAATGGTLHAEGVFEEGDTNGPATVAITFGPQYGPVTAEQVEDAIRSSKRYDELVVAGFSFDAAASSSIQENAHPRLRIHQAYIRPDENPAMDGLLKDKPGSQIFTVFGQPEIEVKRDDDGDWTVTLAGVDIYDPVENTVKSTGADKVAAWFLDGDFDGRCFCVTQAFFPDQDAWDKIAKALGARADAEPFRSFKSTTSLPFKAGKHKRIAVKVIDPRGNEVMSVRMLGK